MKILLVGPPNVGKSALFNRLTGIDVAVANYPGTTVDFKKGEATIENVTYELIDVPGTYSLDAANEAENVAVDFLSTQAAGIIFVLDAKNLESSIYLLLQVIKRNLPLIAVINRVDLVKGELDTDFLAKKLGIPVLKTIAAKGKGIDTLKKTIINLLNGQIPKPPQNIPIDWKLAEEINNKTKEKSINIKQTKIADLLVKPFPGLLIALLIIGCLFLFVVGFGLALRQYLLLPLFENWIFPPIVNTVQNFVPAGIIRNILVGEYGFLIKSIEWPLGLVLPYIISFYAALSILEDSGYIPRLVVLIEGLFKKIRLSGSYIIPLLLGYGCAIPSIMATRTMKNKKERILVSIMVSLSIPCIAQSGAFIALLAEQSIGLVIAVFLFSIFGAVTSGIFLSNFLKIKRDPFIQEVPDLLMPDLKALGKKVWIRIKDFLLNGALAMIVIIGFASILYETGVLVIIGETLSPIITGWLGLPSDAATPLILGIFRRELAVLPLLDMNLNTLQLFVGAIIALFYVPCIAVLGILAKEFGLKISLTVLLMTIIFSFFIGGLIANIGALLL